MIMQSKSTRYLGDQDKTKQILKSPVLNHKLYTSVFENCNKDAS